MAERRTPGAQPFHHNPVMPVQRAGAQTWGASGGGGGGDDMSDALIWFEPSGIVGSTPVTAVNNEGTGGALYTVDTPLDVAKAGQITRGSINGLDTVLNNGTTGAGLIPSAMTNIAYPITVIAVVNRLLPGGNASIFGFYPGAAADKKLAIRMSAIDSNEFQVFQGIQFTGDLDIFTATTTTHVVMAHFNGDATSSIHVQGYGTLSGVNVGSNSLDWGTYTSDGQGQYWRGNVCEFGLYPSDLAAEVSAIKIAHLTTKWDALAPL